MQTSARNRQVNISVLGGRDVLWTVFSRLFSFVQFPMEVLENWNCFGM